MFTLTPTDLAKEMVIKGELKYKAWAKNKNWLPEGKGLPMLQ